MPVGRVHATATRLELLACSGIVHIVGSLLAIGPLTVPGRDIRDVVWPYAPIVHAFAFAPMSEALVAWSDELRSPRRSLRRLLLVARIAVIAAAGAFVVERSGIESAVPVQMRNAALFLGAVLLAPRSPSSALNAIVLFSAASWLLGSRGVADDPAVWALPLAPASSAIAAWSAGAAFVAGTLRFAFAPARPAADGSR